MILVFGKYKGRDTREVPSSYLQWLEDTQTNDLERLRDAMEARGLSTHRPTPRIVHHNLNPSPLVQEMVRVGYKVLARKLHPDLGGSTQRMQELNEAYEVWQESTESSQ